MIIWMIYNKFKEEGLPSIENFYSKLTGEDISDMIIIMQKCLGRIQM